MIPVFDGHNDFLTRLWSDPAARDAIWRGQAAGGHLDLPRMRRGGFRGGFFAIYVPSPSQDPDTVARTMAQMSAPPYHQPLPEPVDMRDALPIAVAQMGHLLWLERQGDLDICRTAAQIGRSMAAGRIAAVMHMEGAEAIGPDLDALYVWHQAGLRSLGPVWSRSTVFGHGVPFAFPASPDTGPGLTPAGHDLIRACDELRIMVDLSHLNEKGFDDVARISDRPLVATHSNAHAICPSSRNLTDRQLAVIAERGGMVGLNFATPFLREDGRRADCGWEVMLRHLDHLLAHLGEDHVGFGSDFDGADIPRCLNDSAGLQGLIGAMARHGYGPALIEKIAYKNWIALLERVWGE
ncbi:membrane dipeptidase [Rhodobacteraceae bacterium]|nr:membrane dipeptidase [Paracoccaceae bacterium]